MEARLCWGSGGLHLQLVGTCQLEWSYLDIKVKNVSTKLTDGRKNSLLPHTYHFIQHFSTLVLCFCQLKSFLGAAGLIEFVLLFTQRRDAS